MILTIYIYIYIYTVGAHAIRTLAKFSSILGLGVYYITLL